MLSSARTAHVHGEYLAALAAQGDHCPFCNPSPSELILSTNRHHLVRNRFPYEVWDGRTVTRHLMIVPRAHHVSMATLSDAEHRDLYALLSRYEPAGYSIYTRAAGNGSRSQAHIHTHLIKTAEFAHAVATSERFGVVPHTDVA